MHLNFFFHIFYQYYHQRHQRFKILIFKVIFLYWKSIESFHFFFYDYWQEFYSYHFLIAMIFIVLCFLYKCDQFLLIILMRDMKQLRSVTLLWTTKMKFKSWTEGRVTSLFIIFIFRYLVAKRMVVKVLLMNQWQVKRQGNFKAWFTTWWWVFSICSLWIQQLIPKLRIWIFTNFLTNQNKLYKSFFCVCFFDRKNLID